MKTSTEIASIAAFSTYEKAVELVAKSGFDAWDFSMFRMIDFDWDARKVTGSHEQTFKKYAKELRKIGEDNGIRCNQSHAPFPMIEEKMIDLCKYALEFTAIAGGEICIVHPWNDNTPEQNAEMYHKLLPTAHEVGVKIATENMWNWENDHALLAACSDEEGFLDVLNATNDDFLTVCLDIGHAEMFQGHTSAVQIIKALGKRIEALHVHDNDCVHDNHFLPYFDGDEVLPGMVSGRRVEYNAVLRALKEVGYEGYMTLEADAFMRNYLPTCGGDVEKGVKIMADHARALANRFDEIK